MRYIHIVAQSPEMFLLAKNETCVLIRYQVPVPSSLKTLATVVQQKVSSSVLETSCVRHGSTCPVPG